jgi:DNA-binding IclR family transcriptional regulator
MGGETIDAYYIAVFATDRAKTIRLKIGRAKPGVDTAAAKAALAGMVEANVLNPEYGNLTGAKALQYVTVTKTPFSVA